MNDTIFANDITKIIKKATASNNIKNYEISEVIANDKGQGFLGKIFTVNLVDKFSDKPWNILLKCAFKDEKIRESVPIRQSFANEIYFYSVIYPTLEAFRKTTKCSNKYSLVPKCYETSMESEMESLVMENLKVQQFEIFDRKLDFTTDHVELIVKNYGYFHAQSLAFKDQNCEKFWEIVAPITNIYKTFVESKTFANAMKRSYEDVYKIFVPGRDDLLMSKFRKYVDNFAEVFNKATDNGGKYSAILHGDCWSNNMLFKNDKASGKPVDMRLIDWQLMKVGSPVCDLAYALYTGVPKSVLDNLDHYLKIYHNTLSSTLTQLGSDPERVFPFAVLKEEWKIYGKFGILMGAMVFRMKCTHSEDVAEFQDVDFDSEDSSAVFFEPKYDVERYDKAIFNLVSHLNEIGAL